MTDLCSTLQGLNSNLLSDSESEIDDVFKFKRISSILPDYRRRQESSSSDGRSSTDRMFIPKSHDRFRSSSCDGRRHPGKPEYIHCRCCGKLKKAKVSFSDDVGDEDESDKCNRKGSEDKHLGYVRQRSESCDPMTKTSAHEQSQTVLKTVQTESDVSSRVNSPGHVLPKNEDNVDNSQNRGRHKERLHGRPPPAPHPSSSSSYRQRQQTPQSRRRFNDPPSDVCSDPSSVRPSGSHHGYSSSRRRQETVAGGSQVGPNVIYKSRPPLVRSEKPVNDSSDNCSETNSDIPIELRPSYIPEDIPRTLRSQSLDRNHRILTQTNSSASEKRNDRQFVRRNNVTDGCSSHSGQGSLQSHDHRPPVTSHFDPQSSSHWTSKADRSERYAHNIHASHRAVRGASHDIIRPVRDERITSKHGPSLELTPDHTSEGSSGCFPHRSSPVRSDQSDVSVSSPSCELLDDKTPDYLPQRPPKPKPRIPTYSTQNPNLTSKFTSISQPKSPTGVHQRNNPKFPTELPLNPSSKVQAVGSTGSFQTNMPTCLPPKPPPRVSRDIPPVRPPKSFKCLPQNDLHGDTHSNNSQMVPLSEPSPPLPPRGRPPRHPTDRPPDRPPKSWLQRKSTSVLASDKSLSPVRPDVPILADDTIPPPVPPRARRSQSVDSVFSRRGEPHEMTDPRRTASEGDNQKLILEILV